MPRARPSFMSARAFAREQTHRRLVVASVASLVFFSTSPVFGHHIAEPLSEMLVGRDHILSLCVIALHEMMAPVHEVFHLLVVVGLAYAVADRTRAIWRLRTALRLLSVSPARRNTPLWRAAIAAGADPAFVQVARGSHVPAFTAGLWSPMVYISEAMAIRLTFDQLVGVIAHEDAHRRRRDPLRLSIWRFLACLLFFVPVVRRLALDMADEAEAAADDDAVSRAKIEPVMLAAALVTVAEVFGDPAPLHAFATPFHRADILQRRVRRLLGEDTIVGTHVTSRSAFGAAGALFAVWFSGIIVTHPLPVATAAHRGHTTPHCAHQHTWAVSHLFCRHSGQNSSPTNQNGRQCSHGVIL